ncbi:MAG TPA: glycosyltransferase family 4 protein, partial [Agriterribacter sp.]|nr:glycosyltransferase family 4 protein [Agriterribacter sp.]
MPPKIQRYLFLYTRLPDYFFRCVQHLMQWAPNGSEAVIVCYPPDDNAPYHYEAYNKIRIMDKTDLLTLHNWRPDMIYIAGWGDKVYNRFAARWIKQVPVIMGMDNPWKGTLKQWLAGLTAPFYLKNKTTHLWVTGYPQYEYARRMGFPANRILHDLYCADTAKFRKRESSFKKRIVFVGRMVEYKRPDWLLEIFSDLLIEYSGLQDWELLMIGNGPLQQTLQNKYSGVKQVSFLTFVQPAELAQYYHQSSVFCMPSLYEHWGVVV